MMSSACRSWIIVSLAAAALAQLATVAAGGVVSIGDLHPSNPGGVSIGFGGIAFDGTPNALVLDKWSWEIKRVSLADAAVISGATSTPVPSFQYNSQLAYDPTTGDFYTTTLNTALVRIDGDTLQHAQVGAGIGDFFNFVGLASDPAGNLWLATDNNGNQLWSVNKQTGVGTVHTQINVPLGDQVQSMLIDGGGHFILSISHNGFKSFYELNPATGNVTLLAPGDNGTIFAMTYDPVSHAYYGIEEGFFLVKIVGVPEPATILLAGFGAIALTVIARRSRRHARRS
jgi:hypothetical protein